MGSVLGSGNTLNPGFGSAMLEEWDYLRQVEQGFSSFIVKFLAYLFHDFSECSLRYFETKIWQKMKESLAQCNQIVVKGVQK